MGKDKFLPLSIAALAIALIISANILANGMRDNGGYVSSGLSNISNGLNGISNTVSYQNYSRTVFGLYEAAEYLGISRDKLVQIVNEADSKIPYVKIDGEYIFSKAALDKWLETVRLEVK